MPATSDSSQRISSESQLREAFEAGSKPREAWRVGTEHEMIGVTPTGAPLDYEGEHGILALLSDLGARGWQPVLEGEVVIGLSKDGQSISLEPGGQFEHASAPVASGEDFCAELRAYRIELAEVSRAHGMTWLCVGFRPFGVQTDVPWMPKGRYRVMREYLPTRGALATEMMRRTATVQVNLDYSDAEDATRKMRAAYSVSSLLTAIYANSPVVDGELAGFQSYRTHIWNEVDPDRCGLLPFAFDTGDIFAAYQEWALDVPMFFVYRDGRYLPFHKTFRAFMANGFGDHHATMSDWHVHLSTLFPEVRLKSYIELRGCDVASHGMIAGLGALSRGFLYDDIACTEATRLTSSLAFDQRLELSAVVARQGLKARVPGRSATVGELAAELVSIARDGLTRWTPEDLHFLEPLEEIVTTGRSAADRIIELFERTTDVSARIAGLTYPEFAKASAS